MFLLVMLFFLIPLTPSHLPDMHWSWSNIQEIQMPNPSEGLTDTHKYP